MPTYAVPGGKYLSLLLSNFLIIVLTYYDQIPIISTAKI